MRLQELYKKLYQKNPDYGSHFHGREACQFIANTLKPHNILDVGCGGNEFAKTMNSEYEIYAVGIDFASPFANIVGTCYKLPCNDKSYDMITCFDMLEHIKEKNIEGTLKEFKRVARRWLFFSIGYKKGRGFDGKMLHLTINNEKWWIKILSNYIKVQKYKHYLWGPLL